MKLFFSTIALLLLTNLTAKSQQHNGNTNTLKTQLEAVAKKYNGTIGIAITGIESKETVTINNSHHYPMQSVFKFPLAMFILSQVDKGKLSLSQKIHVTKTDLRENTWSPLREKYPAGNIDITLTELLEYTVSKSDNNTCDILFRIAKGTAPVNNYIHQCGIKNIAIKATEYEMTQGWPVQYTNWVTPEAMVQLLTTFYKGKQLSAGSNKLLMQLMTESENSAKRLKGLLPESTIVAHKTGTSNKNDKDIIAAVNDVGIITLPNGKHVAIAVFVSDTKEGYETSERIIAEISKVTYDYFTVNK